MDRQVFTRQHWIMNTVCYFALWIGCEMSFKIAFKNQSMQRILTLQDLLDINSVCLRMISIFTRDACPYPCRRCRGFTNTLYAGRCRTITPENCRGFLISFPRTQIWRRSAPFWIQVFLIVHCFSDRRVACHNLPWGPGNYKNTCWLREIMCVAV